MSLLFFCLQRFQLPHPMRGATGTSGQRDPGWNFNSRTLCMGATGTGACGDARRVISTHAPAWGATRLIPRRLWKSDISIPAPCEGCDIILIKKKRRRLVFQFTHPVWGAAQRLRTDILKIIIKYFNSRTLMRYGLTVSP